MEELAVAFRLDATDSTVETGRPFSDFSPDPDMTPVYQLVFKRVRATGQPMRIPYRTDSPTERRYMEMEVAPLADGFVECRIRTVLVHELPAEAPPDSRDPLLPVCAWCRRVRLADGSWANVEEAAERLALFLGPARRLTHGICPTCDVAARHSLAFVP